MIGEHLRVRKDGRWIHAIDCGDETVLHLGDDPPRRVRRAYRPEFVAGAASVEPVLHRERTFAPKEIVRRAYSRAADPTLAAMFADSESFAEWCATGRLPGPRNYAVEARPGVPVASPIKPEPSPTAAKAKPAAKASARAAPKRAGGKAAAKKARAPSRRGGTRPAKAGKPAKPPRPRSAGRRKSGDRPPPQPRSAGRRKSGDTRGKRK